MIFDIDVVPNSSVACRELSDAFTKAAGRHADEAVALLTPSPSMTKKQRRTVEALAQAHRLIEERYRQAALVMGAAREQFLTIERMEI